MHQDGSRTYIARLIEVGGVSQVIEFEATDDKRAWTEANDGVDPLHGHWVEVQRKPDPQQRLEFE